MFERFMPRRGHATARFALALAASLLFSSTPSFAQPADKARVAEAKRNFENGLKLFKEGLYREALAAFLEAKRLQPRPSIQKNIAQCYRELREFSSAHAAFVEWMDSYEKDPSLKAKEVEEIRRAINDLLLLTGTVKINSNETDAVVTIDEREVGKTPIEKPFRLNIGVYRITVSKAGHDKFSRQIEIKGKDTLTLDANLTKEVVTGFVSVSAKGTDPTAILLVDGKEVGPLPWSSELPPGPHTFEIKSEKTTATTRRIELVKGEKAEVQLELLEQSGKLRVDAQFPDAKIYIDDKNVGAGAWEGSVPPGRHEIEVRLSNHEPFKRVVLVRNGDVVDVAGINFVKIKGAPEEEDYKHHYRGVYSQVGLIGLGSATKPSNEIAAQCPADAITGLIGQSGCDGARALGGGLLVRVGYSFGIVGVEGFLGGSFDYSSASAVYDLDSHVNANGDRIASHIISPTVSPHFGISREEKYSFYRYGGVLGVAGRLLSKGQSVRGTGGLGFGLSQKWMIYERASDAFYSNATGGKSTEKFSGDSTSYTAPLLMIDAGLLLGATPGVKLHIGVLTSIEFIPDTKTPANATRTLGVTNTGSEPIGTPALRVAKGPQVFIGPVLGFQFGE